MTARRVPLVVANWKMHKTPSEAAAFAGEFLTLAPDLPAGVESAIAPAFPSLERLGRFLARTGTRLAAQDVHGEARGAFTGEVSAAMLADLGVSLALVGHSERRRGRGENEPLLAQKIARLVEARIAPLYCVGETLAEREAGETDAVLARQMEALDAFAADPPVNLALAYEPVWAIGTGRSASPALARDAHRTIRSLSELRYGSDFAASVRILYGGSVSPENAAALFAEPEIDGALVGGAALVAADFAALIRAAALSIAPIE
ncbi:MAG: triose-phosphate isomerase [Thermoanaerobaculia bacterium]